MMSKDSYMVGILFRMLSYPPPLHLTFPLHFPPPQPTPPHPVLSTPRFNPQHTSTHPTPEPNMLNPFAWTDSMTLNPSYILHSYIAIAFIPLLLSPSTVFVYYVTLFSWRINFRDLKQVERSFHQFDFFELWGDVLRHMHCHGDLIHCLPSQNSSSLSPPEVSFST